MAKIKKTSHSKYFLTLFFVLVLSILSFSTHDVHAISYTAIQSGNWNDPATWGGLSPPITINSTDTTTIPDGITVTIPDEVTVINYGTGTTGSDAGIKVLGTLVNSGNITNYGIVYKSGGTVINNEGGTINNYNILTYSYGTMTNNGAITNYHYMYNVYGILDNNGAINNSGTIDNKFGNHINNNADGTITNDGIINNLHCTQTLPYSVCNGNHEYSIVTNYGIIGNNADGTINNQSDINNQCGSTFDNSGTITGNQPNNLCVISIGGISVNVPPPH